MSDRFHDSFTPFRFKLRWCVCCHFDIFCCVPFKTKKAAKEYIKMLKQPTNYYIDKRAVLL